MFIKAAWLGSCILLAESLIHLLQRNRSYMDVFYLQCMEFQRSVAFELRASVEGKTFVAHVRQQK